MAAVAQKTYKISQEELRLSIEHLKEFVAIPSVSNPHSEDYNKDAICAAANYAGKLVSHLGFKTRQVTIGESAPFILAEKIVDTAKPTLLLYAHFDVQPVDRSKWNTDPFVLTERDGRLYGRGSSDDKGGIIGIITALGAYQKAYGALPVNVKILFEGEEEYGSGHMSALIEQEKDFLKADALVVLDGGNADVNTGTLTNSTRGFVSLLLEVRSMEKPIHSGVGCLAPDPALALAELMRALKNPRTIPGFMDGCTPIPRTERNLLRKSSQTSESYAADHGLIEGARLRGNPSMSIYERIAAEPSISFVNGGWGKPNGGNSIQESARCQISVRLTAGQDPEKITKILVEYLSTHSAVQGFDVQVEQKESGCFAWKGDLSHPLSKMYLEALSENFKTTHVQPTGGAIPFLHDFQAIAPNMAIIMPGVEDPKCAVHSHNESQDIGLLERATNSLISFIHKMGKG